MRDPVRCRWWTVALLLLVHGCGVASSEATIETVEEVRILRGKWWVESRVAALGAPFSFRVDGYRAVTAFVDRNRNGLWDEAAEQEESEPATPCVDIAGAWSCSVERNQITVLRRSTPEGLSTFVHPRLERPVAYCVGDHQGCGSPFRAPATTIANEEGACANASSVWLETSPPIEIALSSDEFVARMAVDIRAEGGLAVRVHAHRPARLRAWMGSEDGPVWDSELSDSLWYSDGDTHMMEIPAAVASSCNDACVVNVAVARHRRWREPTVGALVLEVDEKRFVATPLAAGGGP